MAAALVHITHTSYRTQEMHALYEGGATLGEVADQFGVSRERVRQLFRNAGLPTRSVADTHAIQRDRAIREREQEICEAYAESKDIDDVIRQIDASRSVITTVVDTHFAQAERRGRKAMPRKYSNDELISCLKQVSAALGGVITTAEYTKYARGQRFGDGRPWPTHQTHFKRFGSWRNALAAAELRSNPTSAISGQMLFEQAHCIDALRAVKRQLGKVPTAAEYGVSARGSGGALPSLATVRNRCGTWTAALSAAGM